MIGKKFGSVVLAAGLLLGSTSALALTEQEREARDARNLVEILPSHENAVWSGVGSNIGANGKKKSLRWSEFMLRLCSVPIERHGVTIPAECILYYKHSNLTIYCQNLTLFTQVLPSAARDVENCNLYLENNNI